MLATDIKTSSDLRAFVESVNPNSKFFTRDAMKFFGDTMRNYGVRRVHGVCLSGFPVNAFELFRRKHVKNGLQRPAYFCPVTFKLIYLQPETVVDGWRVASNAN